MTLAPGTGAGPTPVPGADPLEPSPFHTRPTQPNAGFVTRAIALIIDAVLVTITFAVVAAIIGLLGSMFLSVKIQNQLPAIMAAVGTWLLFVGAYFAICWTVTGHTPGMRLMGVRVIDARGKSPHFLRAWVRVIVLGVFFPGVILVLLTKRRQAVHDKVARTTVIYVETDPSNRIARPKPAHSGHVTHAHPERHDGQPEQ